MHLVRLSKKSRLSQVVKFLTKRLCRKIINAWCVLTDFDAQKRMKKVPTLTLEETCVDTWLRSEYTQLARFGILCVVDCESEKDGLAGRKSVQKRGYNWLSDRSKEKILKSLTVWARFGRSQLLGGCCLKSYYGASIGHRPWRNCGCAGGRVRYAADLCF